MSDGDKAFLVTVVEEGSRLFSHTTLKEALEQLDWSEWVRNLKRDLDAHEERLRVLEAKLEHVEDASDTEPLIADPDGVVHVRSLILDLKEHLSDREIMTEDEVLKLARGEELNDE